MKRQNKIKVLVLTLLFLGVYNDVIAQEDPQYTQYMYNTINVNPAYAGSRGVMSIFGLYRSQWVGLEGAPKTANISLNTPLGESGLGLGVSINNDRLGAMDENNVSVDLSYSVYLSNSLKLSFGVKGSANLLNVDYGRLNTYDIHDVVLEKNIKNQITPNVGAGLYLHSEKTYLGLSVPNLLETYRYDDNEISTMKEKMNFYIIGGHVFEFSPSFKFKPAFLLKATQGAPLQLDLTANFLISEKFVIGGAYRWDAAFSGLVGFQISNGIFVGYSYDSDTTKLANFNSGSHEVFLRFELFSRYNQIMTPRFF